MNGLRGRTKLQTGLLAKEFVFCAGIFTGAALLSSCGMTENEDAAYDARLDSIGYLFSENVEDVCIDVATRDAVERRLAGPDNRKDDDGKPLAPEQEFLVRLLEKMDETDIGKRLNESAAIHETIWCVDKNSGFSGYYRGNSKNVVVINPEKKREFQKAKNAREKFNRLLRTAYEENAHAWQNNEWNATVPEGAVPRHHLAWNIAIEASARVTTYSALYQHRQNNDHDVWNDNMTYYSNRSIMQAFEREIEKNQENTITAEAMWEAFDSFYDYDDLVRIYQAHYGEAAKAAKGKQSTSPYVYAEKMGHVPGLEGNYMQGRDFSPDIDRYGKQRTSTIKFGT